MFLSGELFNTVVAHAPLVAIDLIVENHQREILLGRRLNRPAKDFWFVPGGRIYKNESLDNAFSRITTAELGTLYHRSEAALLGVYEHFYSDSVFGEGVEHPDTHYVVISYHIRLKPNTSTLLPDQQHSDFCWKSFDLILNDKMVHQYSKAYVKDLIEKYIIYSV